MVQQIRMKEREKKYINFYNSIARDICAISGWNMYE